MGKRKEPGGEDELSGMTDSPGSSHKKHKKHKKKHKKNRHQEGEYTSEYINVVDDDTPQPTIKLKIKIGGETLGTKNVTKSEITPMKGLEAGGLLLLKAEKDKEGTDNTSDEEREWLDALEKGILDDSGGLKKEKDPKLLTARQRALLHGSKEKDLVQLPTGYQTVELTEEQLQRRQQRAKKRRQQAHEKREKDKKSTLDRLLKKQDVKNKAVKTKQSRKANIPRVRYLQDKKGICISVPTNVPFPLKAQGPLEPPKPPVKCSVEGCTNDKKYNCSKTDVPLCSLECYKKNLASQSKPVEG